VPVVGVLASWLAFGEVPDTVELVAGVAVVGGVLYASRVPRAHPTDGDLGADGGRAVVDDPEEARVERPGSVAVAETGTAPPGPAVRR